MIHHTNLLFSQEELLQKEFLEADLGKLYSAITFEKLAKHIPACANEKSYIAQMFLTHTVVIEVALPLN